MIARHRGEERVHSRWRPGAATGVLPERWDPEPEERLEPDPIEAQLFDRPAAGRCHRARALIVVVVVVAIAAIAAQQQHKSTPRTGLPSTPRQWAQQWTAAAFQNRTRVCHQLLAPALAAAFKTETGRSCQAYFSSSTSRWFRIQHVLQDGSTSVVEAQRLGQGRRLRDFTVLLSHVRDGWQAIDIVPPGSVHAK